MEEVVKFLKEVAADPKAREMLKECRDPENPDHVTKAYLRLAEKMGYTIDKKKLAAVLYNMEKKHKEQAAKAENEVKEALSEDSLENVAGGGTCIDTYEVSEWCWFSDSCSMVINSYDESGKDGSVCPSEAYNAVSSDEEGWESVYFSGDNDDSLCEENYWEANYII